MRLIQATLRFTTNTAMLLRASTMRCEAFSEVKQYNYYANRQPALYGKYEGVESNAQMFMPQLQK